jgi:hypothetical protein
MRSGTKLTIILIFFLCIGNLGFSQIAVSDSAARAAVLDYLRMKGVIIGEYLQRPEISLTNQQAVDFLSERLKPF